MNGYYGEREFRLSGKARDVRAKLKQFAEQAPPSMSVEQWLHIRRQQAAAELLPPREYEASAAPVFATRQHPSGRPGSSSCRDCRAYPMA